MRDWIGTVSTNGLILLCGVVTGILAARLLLPEGRGALAAVIFWPQMIASVGSLSLFEALIYRLNEPDADRVTVISSAFYLGLGLAASVALVGYFLIPLLLGAERASWVPVSRSYLLVFLPVNFSSLILLSAEQGEMRFARFNLLRVLVPIAYLTGLVILWGLGQVDVGKVVWANLSASVIAAFAMIFLARDVLEARPSWREAMTLLARGWRFHLAASVLLIGSQVDRLVVISLFDDLAVGWYMVAFTVGSSGLGVIAGSFQILIYPNIARRETVAEQREYLGKGLRYAMLLIVSATVPIVVSCRWLVPFLFGEEFRPSVAPAMILVIAYLPMALRQIIVRSIRGLGESVPGAVAEAVALLVFVVISLPLGSRFGLAGIGVALLLAGLASLVYLYRHLARRHAMDLSEWWGLNRNTLVEVIQRGYHSVFP